MSHKNLTLRKRNGFTLIELLVVISIISLLASVILASLNSARAKSRDAKRQGDLEFVRTALELYYNDNGKYPNTAGMGNGNWIGMCTTFNNGCSGGGAGSCTTSGASGYIPNLAPTYISVLPRDPKEVAPSNCYLYRSDTGMDYMFLVYGTVEGTVPASLKRPNAPGEQDYSIYTPGASYY